MISPQSRHQHLLLVEGFARESMEVFYGKIIADSAITGGGGGGGGGGGLGACLRLVQQ